MNTTLLPPGSPAPAAPLSLAIDALRNIPRLRVDGADIIEAFEAQLFEHHAYIREHLEDMPAIPTGTGRPMRPR